jgi:hypothetical protein
MGRHCMLGIQSEKEKDTSSIDESGGGEGKFAFL